MPEVKVGVFIPAYKAAKFLPKVLDRISPELWARAAEVFVIDDASGDDTPSVVENYKKEKKTEKLTLLRNEKNQGYGGNQKKAYQYAIGKGYGIVVMLHADGQYPPEKILEMIRPLESNEADLMFGSRMTGSPLKGGMPFHKYFGNLFLTFVENVALGTHLTEFHSGFRAYRCDALAKVPFHLNSDYYHFDTDIIIQFRLKKLRIGEITIPTHYGEEKSYLNVFRYGFSVLGSILQYWLTRLHLMKVPKYTV